ncbi:hypothetical protein [Ramlibacter alkalitolerans]|jgi:hypothetical protein|uniref:Uncharacterized protein n=1 Tax=Ramlibacter alkalitolerans TaxID=2039631 RepID=A0ABS1JIT5_9BURK|nr:hypothetical protein [Ramlibacter alkalitolerans]MBL0424139.1 hypothetical protein [Ramlibacter alkalitolerans]
MYYLLAFTGVIFFLSFVAWREPALRHVGMPHGGFDRPSRGAGAPAAQAAGAVAGRFPLEERKQEKPCLTPVDCVQDGKCAGHCGWR